jgi:hypothetical protein
MTYRRCKRCGRCGICKRSKRNVYNIKNVYNMHQDNNCFDNDSDDDMADIVGVIIFTSILVASLSFIIGLALPIMF